MPRRGEYDHVFPQAANEPGPSGRIGPRLAVIRDARGVMREKTLDPARFGCRRLAGELADEWAELMTQSDPSTGTVNGYRQAVQLFCGHVDDLLGGLAAAASLARAVPDLVTVAAEWERALPAGFSEGSQKPAEIATKIRMLVVRRARHEDRPVDAALLRWAQGRPGVEWGSSDELDEFTRGEKQALEAAAWGWVNALHKRLENGWALAAAGSHPGRAGWTAPADLLFGLATGQATAREVLDQLPDYSRWPAELCELTGLTTRPNNKVIAGFTAVRRLVAQLYPTHMDLNAFQVLLVAATGHVNELKLLHERDVELLERGVRLTLRKNRAGTVRRRAFTDQAPRTAGADGTEPWMVTLVDRPRREPGAVIQGLLQATSKIRAALPETERYLLVAAAVDNQGQLNFGRWQSHGRARFSVWTKAAGVELAVPVHIYRLRKSTKVEKAVASGGQVAAAADDHYVETFRGHYAQGTTLRVMAGRVITTAQQHWLDKALTEAGPVVITGVEDGQEAAQQAGMNPEQAAALMRGELDMGVAACKDPYTSPFSKPGELCSVAPLRCFECRFAFVLPHHLPQQLLFLDHLERQRIRMHPVAFDRAWGRSLANLKAAIGLHTPAEVDRARADIGAGRESLHLPFHAHAEFDA